MLRYNNPLIRVADCSQIGLVLNANMNEQEYYPTFYLNTRSDNDRNKTRDSFTILYHFEAFVLNSSVDKDVIYIGRYLTSYTSFDVTRYAWVIPRTT